MAKILGFLISYQLIAKWQTSKRSKIAWIWLRQSVYFLIASAYSEAYLISLQNWRKTYQNFSFYDSVKFDNIWKQSFHNPALATSSNAKFTCPNDKLDRICEAIFTSVISLFLLFIF